MSPSIDSGGTHEHTHRTRCGRQPTGGRHRHGRSRARPLGEPLAAVPGAGLVAVPALDRIAAPLRLRPHHSGAERHRDPLDPSRIRAVPGFPRLSGSAIRTA